LTIEEIDAELMRMPVSPTEPEDIEARANMMLKRFEVEAAARNAAAERAAAEKKNTWGLPPVNVPPGIDSVVTHTGRSVSTDVVGGKRVMRITAGEMRALAIRNPAWTELNPELAAQ
jgi:hypothetical protein